MEWKDGKPGWKVLIVQIKTIQDHSHVRKRMLPGKSNRSRVVLAFHKVQICPVYWEVPMSTAKLQRIRMGSHLLPIEQGRHLRLPRHRRVCRLCRTGALGDDRHMLLECPALAELRDEFSPLVAECSGVRPVC